MSKRMFWVGFLVSFLVLSLWSTQWIPFDYPSAPFWIVKYWEIRDQLFGINHYVMVFFPISLVIGLVFGYLKSFIKFLND